MSFERVLSIARHVVNAKRACLLPDNVNMLVFLADNVDKCLLYAFTTFLYTVRHKIFATEKFRESLPKRGGQKYSRRRL